MKTQKWTATEKHLNSQMQRVPTRTLPTEATHTALRLREERSLKNGTVIFIYLFVRPPHRLQQVVPQSPSVLRICQTCLVKMVCGYINLKLHLPWLCRWKCSCSFGNICPENNVFKFLCHMGFRGNKKRQGNFRKNPKEKNHTNEQVT